MPFRRHQLLHGLSGRQSHLLCSARRSISRSSTPAAVMVRYVRDHIWLHKRLQSRLVVLSGSYPGERWRNRPHDRGFCSECHHDHSGSNAAEDGLVLSIRDATRVSRPSPCACAGSAVSSTNSPAQHSDPVCRQAGHLSSASARDTANPGNVAVRGLDTGTDLSHPHGSRLSGLEAGSFGSQHKLWCR